MNAIRKIEYVKSGSVTIDLPADFQEKRVEIIILPIEESEDGRRGLPELQLQNFFHYPV